eukprot:TRINITY_DN21972_c0_g1_i1.p1 TRINITY_DN21972_c0_g1~~TRINITY_DN21972_c0_g1_i1.p1  ORF type:complete len:355 (-),score=64.44 TRINITY_DN21972_c0_g1_i1:432-1457(-)
MATPPSSADHHHHHSFTNTLSSSLNSQKPFLSSPPPAPSPPPPPPNPPLYTAQPIIKPPNPNQMPKIQEQPIPPPPQGILHPIVASNRGFSIKNARPSQPSDQLVTVANPGGLTASARNPFVVGFANQARPFGLPVDHQGQPVQAMRPPLVQPSQLVSRPIGGAGSGVRSLHFSSLPKVISYPTLSSTSDINSLKDLRDKSRDDAVVMIKDRKVRLLDGPSSSLYALCRSWVRNGLPQESQPHFGEGLKLLPRPLPPTVADSNVGKKNDDDEEEFSSKEDAAFVEHKSVRNLLDGHIKRAKKVRARLRKERLQRIDRYKQRLTLLLPPPVEKCMNNAAAGN